MRDSFTPRELDEPISRALGSDVHHDCSNALRQRDIFRERIAIAHLDATWILLRSLDVDGVPLRAPSCNSRTVEDHAWGFEKTLSPDVRAVYINIDPLVTEQIRREWQQWGQGVPLVVLESPYRSLMEPMLEYIEQVDAEHGADFLTVVLPEFVPARWWRHLFHNQRALLIKGALLFKPHIVVTSVPFHLRR